MIDFKFIVVPELRQCLESDYRELRACLDAKAWKAVHLLAGSITEAVLIDALGTVGLDQTKLEKMFLPELIQLAGEKHILDSEAVDLSTVIRAYRNLIHPGRVIRLEKTVDASGALIAAELVGIITKQVARKKQQTYGFTAEQLFDRLRGGSSALPIITHLLTETPPLEVERLLTEILPFELLTSLSPFELLTNLSDAQKPSEDANHLSNCFHGVFEATTDDVRAKVMKYIHTVCKTKPEATVVLYEDCFVKPAYLAYLPPNEREFLKAHFFPRLWPIIKENPFYTQGIGPYLTEGEAGEFTMLLMDLVQGSDPELAKVARLRIIGEYHSMKEDSRSTVRNFVEVYAEPKLLETLLKYEAKLTRAGPAAHT